MCLILNLCFNSFTVGLDSGCFDAVEVIGGPIRLLKRAESEEEQKENESKEEKRRENECKEEMGEVEEDEEVQSKNAGEQRI